MKNLTIKLMVSTLFFAGMVLAQPPSFTPRGALALPPSELMRLDMERLSAPVLSGDQRLLGAQLAELSGSLSSLHLANVDMLRAEMALVGIPHPIIVPELALLGSLNFNLDMMREELLFEDDSPQQDPGYQAYKEGYNLILQEKWADARRKLGELASKFPSSRYVDDAQYWIAYSWMNNQPKKAAELYRAFFKKYPSSNYFDDAVADLGRLEGKEAADSARASRAVYDVQRMARGVAAVNPVPPVGAVPPVSATAPAVVAVPSYDNDDEDPELKLKKDAIIALGRKPDESAFTTLSEIALDPKQHRELRESALYALQKFDRERVLGVYVKLAQTDPDVELRQNAVYHIGRFAKNNDAQALSVLQQCVLDSKQPRKVRESAMHGLREIRNADALNLYLQIAKNDPEPELRQSALYYIGQLARKDDAKAIGILREYALDKSQPKEVRETAMHSLKEIKNADALAVYLEVAKNDPDERLRRSALYYIGQLARKDDNKAYQVLKDYALDTKQDPEVRETALHSLRELRRADVVPILVELAKSDPSEKIRSNAVYQIGQMRRYNADVSKVLVEIARDRKQPTEIRKTAIYSLREFTDFDVQSFYMDLAKNDPDKDIQQSAIYYLGRNSKDKAQSMELLVKLFNELPADRTEAQESCLYGIANIGGEAAVDFLIKVAKTHKNYEMRQKAVYYLGNIGGEKARSALMEILQGK